LGCCKYSSPYYTENPVSAILLNKISVPGGSKSSGKLYLVFKDAQTSKNFDIEVRPAFYTESVIGQTYTFSLSDSFLDKPDTGYYSVSSAISFLMFLVSIGCSLFYLADKYLP
jgi:hypothetical protein